MVLSRLSTIYIEVDKDIKKSILQILGIPVIIYLLFKKINYKNIIIKFRYVKWVWPAQN